MNIQEFAKELYSEYGSNKDEFKKHVKLFSKYIYITNSEYIYNETYIEEYLKKIDRYFEKYRERNLIVGEIKNKIREKHIDISQIDIIIDHLWDIKNNNIEFNTSNNLEINKYLSVDILKENKIIDSRSFEVGKDCNKDKVVEKIIEFININI